MSLVGEVIKKRANYKEALEAEMVMDEEGFEETEAKAEKVKKTTRTTRKKPIAQRVEEKSRGEWAVISRINDSFCTIMESPQLVRRLTDETFTEMVDATVMLFRHLCAKQMDEIDE